MNIEMNEETSTTIIVCVAAVCLAASVMYGCHEIENTRREAEATRRAAFEQGMEELQVEGGTGKRLGWRDRP